MSVQNIVLVVGIVSLLFSFYYTYTLDSKFRELKKELKDLKNNISHNNTVKEEYIIKDDDEEEDGDIYEEEITDNQSDMTVISESELIERDDVLSTDDNVYSQVIEENIDIFLDEKCFENVIPSNLINIFYKKKDEEYEESKIKEIKEDEEKPIEESEEKPIEESEEKPIEDKEECEEEENDEDEYPLNICRVKIKSGARKGQICGKKTKGVPYCNRHGLYN